MPLNTPNEFKGMHADDRGPYVAHSKSMKVVLQIVEHVEVNVPPTTPNPQGSTVPETSLLQAGSTLAKEAFYQSGWKNRRQVNHKFALNPDGCFVWAQKPPKLSDKASSAGRRVQLSAWGESFMDEEVFRLHDLDEFQHAIHLDKSPQNYAVEERRAETGNAAGDLQPREKRKLFSGSLHGIIAQPHFYSSALNTVMRGHQAQVPAYMKRRSTALSLYGESVVQPLHLLSGYARTSWIIPVRGILPWKVTSAVILEDSEDFIGKEGIWIQWTKAALTSFWAFLQSVREAGKLGQVGISLHVATARERETSLSVDAVNEQYSSSELQMCNLPLSSADYVKIYHEATNAMALRSVLDAWAYMCPDGRKVRVLKGSKLILVDERSKGILVS